MCENFKGPLFRQVTPSNTYHTTLFTFGFYHTERTDNRAYVPQEPSPHMNHLRNKYGLGSIWWTNEVDMKS